VGLSAEEAIKADRITLPFQHHALQIVVEQDTWNTVPGAEGGDMAAQKVLHPCVEEEAQEDLARVAEHRDECHQRTPRAADLKMAKMSPIDLSLLA
jgi:hypothetical protein